MDTPQSNRGWGLWWIAGYIGLLGLVVSSLFWARQSARSKWSSPESISEWRAWRDDVQRQQSGPKTVERRVPKSDEPPALVLMRDYSLVMMVGALLFSSVLYWIVVWFIMGIVSCNRAGKAHIESQ